MRYFIVIVILNGFMIIVCEQKRVSVRIEEIQYESNPAYIHLNGSINKNGAISIDIHCIRPVPHLHMSLETGLINFLGRQDVTIMNRTMDYCRRRRKNEREEPLWQLFISLVDASGNITKACPFQPGYYCVHNFMISELDVPNFVPNAKFKIFYQVFTENDIGDLDWVARFACRGSVGKFAKKVLISNQTN